MKPFRIWRRVELVVILHELNEELAGLNAQARDLEATIAANVVGILELGG